MDIFLGEGDKGEKLKRVTSRGYFLTSSSLLVVTSSGKMSQLHLADKPHRKFLSLNASFYKENCVFLSLPFCPAFSYLYLFQILISIYIFVLFCLFTYLSIYQLYIRLSIYFSHLENPSLNNSLNKVLYLRIFLYSYLHIFLSVYSLIYLLLLTSYEKEGETE